MIRAQRRFLLLLAIFVAAALIQQAILPVMEGGDEGIHSDYVQFVLANNRLPDRSSFTPGILQESGQPPFYYWVGAQVLHLLRIPPSDPATVFNETLAVRNPWFAAPDQWNPIDNRNTLLHGTTEHFNLPDAESAVRVLRLISLIFGVVAVIGANGAMRELFKHETWALVGTAIFALTPQMVQMSAIVSNDIAATTLSVLILWQTLVLLRKGLALPRLLLIGVLLGLGGLSKINVLLLAPAVGVALLIVWRRQHNMSLLRFIGAGVAVIVPFALIFGWWVLWGWLNFHDPLGTAPHQRPGFFYDPPLTLAQIMPLVPEVYLSYWGKLGAEIYLHPLTYTLFGLLLVLALIGLLWKRPRISGLVAGQTFVLLIAFIISAVGLFHWLQTIQYITGRLLYPAHLAIAAGITAGLMRFPRRLVQTFALGVLMSSVVIAPMDIVIAFQPPPLLANPPPLQGAPVDYAGRIRLLGDQQDSPILSGNLHTITLCWRVLSTQATTPLTYSVKFIHDGKIVGDRTTIFGLGRFPSDDWHAGDTFCDTVDVPLKAKPESGQVYDIAVVLLNAQTLASDIPATDANGQPLSVPFIGQVVSPADQLASLSIKPSWTRINIPSLAELAQFAVNGELTAGKSVELNLDWYVLGRTNEDWSEFIHLIGPDGEIVLADGKPRGGNYPTWAWSPGEYIVDSWPITLPADLKPGKYSVVIGFYSPATGARIPIFDGDQPAPNNSATLLSFKLP